MYAVVRKKFFTEVINTVTDNKKMISGSRAVSIQVFKREVMRFFVMKGSLAPLLALHQ